MQVGFERSETILNKNFLFELVPVYTLGEGNCLFRAVSISMFGDGRFYKYLRICTIYIFIKHFDFFRNNSTWNSNNFRNHVIEMSRDKVFGEEDESSALSFIFNKPILFFSNTVTLEYFIGSHHERMNLEPISIYFEHAGAGHFTCLLARKKFKTNTLKDYRPQNTVVNAKILA